uniref:Putative ovule protein n=1 Tax=Solanum chacoense TaxID=4108 RepID=A0A0V0GZ53_SOLCH
MVVEDQDKILWGNSKEKTYTVKECYKNMSSQNGILLIWSWKHVWKTRQPLIVSCFTWTALKEACLTQDNLRKKRCNPHQQMCHVQANQ